VYRTVIFIIIIKKYDQCHKKLQSQKYKMKTVVGQLELKT